jgi:hypothetical protein
MGKKEFPALQEWEYSRPAGHSMALNTKYFCISFHKTGTRSIHQFMLAGGLTALHHPKDVGGVDWQRKLIPMRNSPGLIIEALHPVIDAASVHADVPWAGIYGEIAAAYPEAKFILVKRDPAEWFKSISHHWSLDLLKHRMTPLEYIQYVPYFGTETGRLFGPRDRDLFIHAFTTHERNVQERLPAERLLVLNLGEESSAQKLAAFAGLSTAPAFPRIGIGKRKTSLQRLPKNILKRFRYALDFRFPATAGVFRGLLINLPTGQHEK